MSDYRFCIVKHNEIDCLHVMIDAEEIAHTYIPIDDIQTAIKRMKNEQAGDQQETHITHVCVEGIWWSITLIIRVRDGQPVFVTVAEIKKSP